MQFRRRRRRLARNHIRHKATVAGGVLAENDDGVADRGVSREPSFDLAGPTFRAELAADYKANRTPMPPDLAEQVPWVREACEALGVPVLTFARYEADDVIGTLARQARERGFDVAIVTGDKDFFQLVGDGIKVYNPRDEGFWFDEAGVVEKLGVRPEQVVDVLALMGDSIDNIKGVPGIGEKGARELIAAHGTLEALLAAAPTLAQKRYREALMTHADSARALMWPRSLPSAVRGTSPQVRWTRPRRPVSGSTRTTAAFCVGQML